jgi:hypothetical protein
MKFPLRSCYRSCGRGPRQVVCLHQAPPLALPVRSVDGLLRGAAQTRSPHQLSVKQQEEGDAEQARKQSPAKPAMKPRPRARCLALKGGVPRKALRARCRITKPLGRHKLIAKLSPDGRLLALAQRPPVWLGDPAVVVPPMRLRGIELWDVATCKRVRRLRLKPKRNRRPLGVSKIAFSPDNMRLAAAFVDKAFGVGLSEGPDDRFPVWHLASGRLLASGTGREPSPLLDLAFSPDSRVFVGRFYWTIRIWDRNGTRIADGEKRDHCGNLHEGRVDLAFSNDSRWVTSPTWGSDSFCIWSTRDGKHLRRVDAPARPKYGRAPHTTWTLGFRPRHPSQLVATRGFSGGSPARAAGPTPGYGIIATMKPQKVSSLPLPVHLIAAGALKNGPDLRFSAGGKLAAVGGMKAAVLLSLTPPYQTTEVAIPCGLKPVGHRFSPKLRFLVTQTGRLFDRNRYQLSRLDARTASTRPIAMFKGPPTFSADDRLAATISGKSI